MKFSYQKAIIAGAIAGLVSGIQSAILTSVGISIRLFGIYEATLGPAYNLITAVFILTIIFGTIFALIYSKLYDSMPGKNVMKGLYFGLMIWLFKDITAGSYVIFGMEQIDIGIDLIVGGVYMWITYGLVLGYLYRKPPM